MCGRFNVTDSPGIQQLLQDLGIDLKLPPGINIAPTQKIGLLRQVPDTDVPGSNELLQARWWLTPPWAKSLDTRYAMFNARSETLGKSRAYHTPFLRQRGVVPMSSFIEWRQEDGVRQPYLFSTASGALAIAALWEVWHGEEPPLVSCTLVTTAAAPEFEPWHQRMPVMLNREECARWMNNQRQIADNDPLFEPRLKEGLHVAPLDRRINNARASSADLLDPIADPLWIEPAA
jgi:putative SOS response-associated peptidase YedK